MSIILNLKIILRKQTFILTQKIYIYIRTIWKYLAIDIQYVYIIKCN